MPFTIHKSNNTETTPKVSIILLDWSVRERFQALEWLPRQNVPRTDYELIWIELYDRVVPEALELADVVITCHQQGQYHKHIGYNIGLLQAKGQIITICDSDAVFPPDFVASILNSFHLTEGYEPIPLVLMHYQWRTHELYPDELTNIKQISRYKWHELWPNAGACMSVRTIDAIGFGGFDEHRSFRGYMCGPYDLGWRMINAGIPEVWHDPSVALWHFAHPNPMAAFGQRFSFKLWREIAYPHVDGHALKAVEAFSTGRLLPLRENLEIYRRRLAQRRISTEFEKKYGQMASSSLLVKLRLYFSFFEPFNRVPFIHRVILNFEAARATVSRQLLLIGGAWLTSLAKFLSNAARAELILENYKNFNIVLYQHKLHAISCSLGPVNFNQLDQITVNEFQIHEQYWLADSLDEAKRYVDQLIPELVKQNYQNFNIVSYRNKFYALAQTLGPVDLTKLDKRTLCLYQERGQCFIASTIHEIKELVDSSGSLSKSSESTPWDQKLACYNEKELE